MEGTMIKDITLSQTALSLLCSCVAGHNPPVTDANREVYRELVSAGILYPLSGFIGGEESSFRFTLEGWDRREEWLNDAAPRP